MTAAISVDVPSDVAVLWIAGYDGTSRVSVHSQSAMRFFAPVFCRLWAMGAALVGLARSREVARQTDWKNFILILILGLILGLNFGIFSSS